METHAYSRNDSIERAIDAAKAAYYPNIAGAHDGTVDYVLAGWLRDEVRELFAAERRDTAKWRTDLQSTLFPASRPISQMPRKEIAVRFALPWAALGGGGGIVIAAVNAVMDAVKAALS